LIVDLGGISRVADLAITGGIEVEASVADITGCQLSPGAIGILFHNASGSILDNVITGGATGILARQGSDPTISGNTVTETTERGIACESGSAPHIDSNILTGSGGTGIDCTNDPIITGNSITGFSVGMNLRSGLALAMGNTVVGASNTGIHISSTTPDDYPTVRGNTIAQGGGVGVLFEWTGGTLESNVITGNAGPGVEIEGGFEDFLNPVLLDHPVILGNSIISNSEQGVYVWGSLIAAPLEVAAPTIVGNIISGNAGFGIEQTLSTPSLAYNNVFGNLTGESDGKLGDTDISLDPLFVNIGSGNFTLTAESPCIDLVGSDVLWTGPLDRAGADRVTDGDGDGIALADAGAFEFVLTCPDADGDGYFDPDCADKGEGDCDDSDASINPGADEIWYDGIDQNCDGNDEDQDGDGFIQDEDCDDTDASIAPGDCADVLDPGFLDEEGCDCSMGESRPTNSLMWLLLLAAGRVRRRR
jgi:MYXO-CTERM domain-containing protein